MANEKLEHTVLVAGFIEGDYYAVGQLIYKTKEEAKYLVLNGQIALTAKLPKPKQATAKPVKPAKGEPAE
ncbi:MAG: hypothetical protein ROR55_19980 [Devosia sp.]